MEIQAALGSDVAMAFDECPPYPCELEYASVSLERTLRWAQRCRTWAAEWKNENRPLVFGIVQGAVYSDLREKSARSPLKWISMDTRSGALASASRSPK